MRSENAAEPSISTLFVALNVLLRYPLRNLLARCNGLRPSHVCPFFWQCLILFTSFHRTAEHQPLGFLEFLLAIFSPSYAQRGHPHPPSYPPLTKTRGIFRSHYAPIINTARSNTVGATEIAPTKPGHGGFVRFRFDSATVYDATKLP